MKKYMFILLFVANLMLHLTTADTQVSGLSTTASTTENTITIPEDLYRVMLQTFLRETTQTNTQDSMQRLATLETELEFYKDKLDDLDEVKKMNNELKDLLKERKTENANLRCNVTEMEGKIEKIQEMITDNGQVYEHGDLLDIINSLNRTLQETTRGIVDRQYIDNVNLIVSVENLKNEMTNITSINNEQNNRIAELGNLKNHFVEFVNGTIADVTGIMNATTDRILQDAISGNFIFRGSFDDEGNIIEEGVRILSSNYDCKDLYTHGDVNDGVYTISPDGETKFQAYCDMTNKGWTVIQKRFDGAASFNRTFYEYANGFGFVHGDHWLGLNYIHLLTNNRNSQILFNVTLRRNGGTGMALYRGFYIEGGEQKYRMHLDRDYARFNSKIALYITSRGGFIYHNNQMFSTRDQDNDDNSRSSCAQDYNCGGYWFGNCYEFGCFNGPFNRMDTGRGSDIASMEIKIRRGNDEAIDFVMI